MCSTCPGTGQGQGRQAGAPALPMWDPHPGRQANLRDPVPSKGLPHTAHGSVSPGPVQSGSLLGPGQEPLLEDCHPAPQGGCREPGLGCALGPRGHTEASAGPGRPNDKTKEAPPWRAAAPSPLGSAETAASPAPGALKAQGKAWSGSPGSLVPRTPSRLSLVPVPRPLLMPTLSLDGPHLQLGRRVGQLLLGQEQLVLL